MLKHITNLLKDKIIIIAILVSVGILCLSLIKMPETGIKVANIDKGYHSIAYFILTITWLLSFYKKPQKKYIIAISCIIFGIIIELLQASLTVYREGDYFDVLANSLGVLLALSTFSLFFKKNDIN
ncbi:VanZ family protein [Polaribacter litorisediminis]|uniref:VanZ family protein n=1 Tax=Polaribacter litorisediminis TaxID=1908341 RepID=UPI001CC14AB4|nr:VanZ family protein [Polaribacter litorisediminis]